MQPETITAIAGGVVTVALAIARVIVQHVKRKKKRAESCLGEIRARKMPDPRAASDALALCERVVAAAEHAVSRKEKIVLDKDDHALVATYEQMLRRAPRGKLVAYVDRTLPLFFLAVYYAATSAVAAEIDTFRAAARRLHLPDTVCVLGRVGNTHVPLRIEPRGSLRPLVEGEPLEGQLCAAHAEENDLAMATIRGWTSNEREVKPVTIRPAYATALTMHLVRADEGACVVCVSRDRDDALGVLLRALYKNEHTFVLRVDAGVVAAVCAGLHAGALVADALGAEVAALLHGPEAQTPRGPERAPERAEWDHRACSAYTVRVGTSRFIFVSML